MKNKSRRRKTCGAAAFTLIELLAVIVIIMAVVGLVIRAGRYAVGKAQRNRAQVEIAAIEMALENFKADNGYYPVSNGLANSTVLFSNLVGGAANSFNGSVKRYLNFHGSQLYISGVSTSLADPFGGQYYYLCPGATNRATFDLWSRGPDLSNGTPDDITNWQQ